MEINYLAVLLSGVATMIIGFVWYGPLFGKVWMRESGKTPEMMEGAKARGMTKAYIITFVFSIITACILSRELSSGGTISLSEMWSRVFLIWLGFMMPIDLGSIFWEGKSFKYFLVNTAGRLVSILVVGIILVSLA